MAALSVPDALAVDCATECHVTPPAVAATMVDYLRPDPQRLTLEPQAGTGNLIHALLDSGCILQNIRAVERHQSLCSVLRNRFDGLNLFGRCFLDYAQDFTSKQLFAQILMNPPFRHVRKHMSAALSLLDWDADGGCSLVALVPITYEHEDAYTCEVLDCDTFAAAKVSTKIICFEN
jgi:phospholipid N-methyltransferase